MNEVGIVLSGPVIKNRLFLFGNYGQYRYQQGAKPAAMTIPTSSMLGYDANGNALGYADFRGYAAANGGAHIYDPSTSVVNCLGTVASPCSRKPFMGSVNGVPTADVIPASRFSAAANNYNKYMLPYEKLANQTLYNNNLTYGYPHRTGQLVRNRQDRLHRKSAKPDRRHCCLRPSGQHRSQLDQRPWAPVQYVAVLSPRNHHRYRQRHLHHQCAPGQPVRCWIWPLSERLGHTQSHTGLLSHCKRHSQHAGWPGFGRLPEDLLLG